MHASFNLWKKVPSPTLQTFSIFLLAVLLLINALSKNLQKSRDGWSPRFKFSFSSPSPCSLILPISAQLEGLPSAMLSHTHTFSPAFTHATRSWDCCLDCHLDCLLYLSPDSLVYLSLRPCCKDVVKGKERPPGSGHSVCQCVRTGSGKVSQVQGVAPWATVPLRPSGFSVSLTPFWASCTFSNKVLLTKWTNIWTNRQING